MRIGDLYFEGDGAVNKEVKVQIKDLSPGDLVEVNLYALPPDYLPDAAHPEYRLTELVLMAPMIRDGNSNRWTCRTNWAPGRYYEVGVKLVRVQRHHGEAERAPS